MIAFESASAINQICLLRTNSQITQAFINIRFYSGSKASRFDIIDKMKASRSLILEKVLLKSILPVVAGGI